MLKAKPFIDYQSVITICSIVASRDVQIPRLNKQTTNNSFQTAVAGTGSVVDRSLCECSVCVSRFTVLAWLLVRAGWKPQRRPRGSRLDAPNTKTHKHNSFFLGGGCNFIPQKVSLIFALASARCLFGRFFRLKTLQNKGLRTVVIPLISCLCS